MRSEQEANRAIERYADMVVRLCTLYLKNHADTEDIFQTVFLKYVLSSVCFESEQHEKAWFIHVTINACKDILKSPWRKKTCGLDVVADIPAPEQAEHSLLSFVQNLPIRYRTVIYLYYYEEYSTQEIGQLLGISTAAVHTRLSRGRTLLKKQLGGDDYAQRI